MSKLIFQATSLRALVKLLLPSAECKSMSECDFSTLSLHAQEVAGEGAGAQAERSVRYVLYGETHHTCFSLGIQLVLTTDQVELGQDAVRVKSRELDRALASFGQKTVQMELLGTNGIRISTLPPVDADGMPTNEPTRQVYVKGSGVLFNEQLPEPLPEGSCAILPDRLALMEGLKSCLTISAIRGNAMRKGCVRLHVDSQRMTMEGQNPEVHAIASYESPWITPPPAPIDVLLSPDSIRHLLAALSASATGEEVCIAQENGYLTIQTDSVCAKCDCE